MSKCQPIHDLTVRLGLTSRTLRHWEDKGLFSSQRDPQSGWRIFDQTAIDRIRLIRLLRGLEIAISDIKAILDSEDKRIAIEVLEKQCDKLTQETQAIRKQKCLIQQAISALKTLQLPVDTAYPLVKLESTLAQQISCENTTKSLKEDVTVMSDAQMKVVQLAAMRVAVCNVVSDSPEDQALGTVLDWAKEHELMGTGRIFGFNTTPYSPESKEYGWAASITVPEGVAIPDFLEEKRLEGGLYALLESSNEVYDSWQKLTAMLRNHPQYVVDRSRGCLEEHIPTGEPPESGNQFYLNLLEPVIRK